MRQFLYLIIFLCSISCNKSKETCHYPIYYPGAEIVLSGYDTSVVDYILHQRYDPISNTLVNENILEFIDHNIEDGLIYLITTPNTKNGGPIEFNYNHKIIINTDTFSISDIIIGERIHYFEVEGHCSPGAGQARWASLQGYTMNGEQIILEDCLTSTNNCTVILEKP